MRGFETSLVEVAFATSRKGVNDFQGAKRRGVQHEFEVVDRNFQSRHGWKFAVFVPTDWHKGTYVSVRPLTIPNRKEWSALERRSIQLAPCTMRAHRGWCYAKVFVSDISGEKNREALRADDARPPWLDGFRLRTKERVTTSKANDGRSLVAVLEKEDLPGMIRLFIATRAWTLTGGFSRADAGLARRYAKDRAMRARTKLRGLTIAITGFLGMGTRLEVRRFLEKNGATVRVDPSPLTDVLIEGYHGLGDHRLKVKAAKRLNVKRMTEAQFRRKYAV